MSWVTPALVASLCTALATILGSVQAVTSKSRRRLRRLSAQVDAMEEYTWGVRREVRRFNSRLPDEVEPMRLPDVPEFLKDTVDGGGE
ncbi:minor tail protein [Propionibacterium phage LilBandit]|nr:minor tail protein [Propionibacterium phage LilBandit]